MPRRWLAEAEIEQHLTLCPDDLRDLILELRDVVRDVAPEAQEAIKFHSLVYFKPDAPWGAIGGNVCGIGWKDDRVLLSFIHGAFLPDPQGLLQGKAKAKRDTVIRSSADIQRPAIRDLIRAAAAYTPMGEEPAP